MKQLIIFLLEYHTHWFSITVEIILSVIMCSIFLDFAKKDKNE